MVARLKKSNSESFLKLRLVKMEKLCSLKTIGKYFKTDSIFLKYTEIKSREMVILIRDSIRGVPRVPGNP